MYETDLESEKTVMKVFIILTLMLIAITLLTRWPELDKFVYNIQYDFSHIRQLTVIDCLQEDVLFQMTGKMSITADRSDNQLKVIVEDENGEYKKHFIGLSDNVTYVVEDITSGDVSKYQYTLNFNPDMWLPVEVDTID